MAVTALTRGRKEVSVPKGHDRKIDAIIRKGLQLKARLVLTREAIETNNDRLIPYAEQLAGSTGLKSAVFRGSQGTVTVKFNERIVYDEKDMAKIKTALGPIFSQMFHEVPSFAVNPEDIPEIKEKLGADFDRLVQQQATFKHTMELAGLIADGDSETAKRLRDFISIETKKPTVSYERTAAE